MMQRKLPQNFKVKLLSVLVAFGMWIYVMEMDPILVRSIENVPIANISNMSEIYKKGLAISHDQHMATNIDFRGKRSSLLKYIASNPMPTGSIKDSQVGENTLELSLDAPSDVEYSFDPINFIVHLEESVLVEKPIEIVASGTLKEEFSVGQIHLNKQKAYIEGPKSQVEKVTKLYGNVNVDGAAKNFSVRVQLVPRDSKDVDVTGVTIHGDYAIADVQVEKNKEVPVEIQFVNAKGTVVNDSSYKTNVDKVVITGKPEQLETISKVKTQKITLESIAYNLNKEFELESIEGVKYSIKGVKIQPIPEEQTEYRFTLSDNDVNLTNVINEDKIINNLPETIEVSFFASKSYETVLTEDKIRLYIENKSDSKVYPIRLEIDYPINGLVLQPDQIKLN